MSTEPSVHRPATVSPKRWQMVLAGRSPEGTAQCDTITYAVDVRRDPTGPGQESVWDYPRPPRLERESRPARIVFGSTDIALSKAAWRVLETSHPPGIYLPRVDFRPGALTSNPKTTVCEWKGVASYWDICSGERTVAAGAWSYESPAAGFEAIAGHISVYPDLVDSCFLGDERVSAQEGDFYGGWITREIVGPFKGSAGTWGW